MSSSQKKHSSNARDKQLSHELEKKNGKSENERTSNRKSCVENDMRTMVIPMKLGSNEMDLKGMRGFFSSPFLFECLNFIHLLIYSITQYLNIHKSVHDFHFISFSHILLLLLRRVLFYSRVSLSKRVENYLLPNNAPATFLSACMQSFQKISSFLYMFSLFSVEAYLQKGLSSSKEEKFMAKKTFFLFLPLLLFLGLSILSRSGFQQLIQYYEILQQIILQKKTNFSKSGYKETDKKHSPAHPPPPPSKLVIDDADLSFDLIQFFENLRKHPRIFLTHAFLESVLNAYIVSFLPVHTLQDNFLYFNYYTSYVIFMYAFFSTFMILLIEEFGLGRKFFKNLNFKLGIWVEIKQEGEGEGERGGEEEKLNFKHSNRKIVPWNEYDAPYEEGSIVSFKRKKFYAKEKFVIAKPNSYSTLILHVFVQHPQMACNWLIATQFLIVVSQLFFVLNSRSWKIYSIMALLSLHFLSLLLDLRKKYRNLNTSYPEPTYH